MTRRLTVVNLIVIGERGLGYCLNPSWRLTSPTHKVRHLKGGITGHVSPGGFTGDHVFRMGES